MRFYDRHEELRLLEESAEAARQEARFTLLIGRRRVGKTALLMESIRGRKAVYLFVSRKSEALLCEEFQRDAGEILGLEIFGTISRFKDLFEQLLKYSVDHPFTLIIDEFQDFERVNKSIFSEIQDIWDRQRASARLNLIVCGSIYSMMTRIFENDKEPLFGRLTSKIVLQPFTVNVVREILEEHNARFSPEDLLCLYMITGGVPKYIALLMDAKATTKEKMLDYVCALGSPFLTDGKDVLVSEFGKDYSTYFSIMQLIASNRTSQSEIDSIIGKNTGAYLLNLEQEFTAIERNRPIFSKPGSRNVKWRIRDSYLRFWFRYIYANQSLVETGRTDLLRELIANDYRDYSGLILEDFFRRKLSEEGRYIKVGSSWDRKGTSELDIVAVNSLDRKVLIAEVKRNPKRLDRALLEEKAKSLGDELAGYEIELRGFSLDDVVD